MLLVFPGVVGPVSPGCHADSVDQQKGAVQDHERLVRGDLHSVGQGRGQCGEYVEGLADVAEQGGGADGEPGGQVGEGTRSSWSGEMI